jgi:hypothetical protein
VLASGCSTAHSDGDDAGIVFTPGDSGGVVLGGEDGGGGVVILVDGALALPDGALVDRDGALLSGTDAAVIVPRIDSGVPTAHVGDPCTTEAQCPGLFCSPGNNGFGYCTWLCTPEMPCPDGAACYAATPGEAGYCMPRCNPADPSSCHTGFLCQPGLVDTPVCYPGCTGDSDCAGGARCGEGVSGVRSCYQPDASVGDPCEQSSECPELGYCLDEVSWGTPQGLCVTFCELATHSGCGTGTTCVAWGFEGGYGSCVPTCDDANPCRGGYQCVSTGSGLPNACVARCTEAADCTAPHACNFVTGRCG